MTFEEWWEPRKFAVGHLSLFGTVESMARSAFMAGAIAEREKHLAIAEGESDPAAGRVITEALRKPAPECLRHLNPPVVFLGEQA